MNHPVVKKEFSRKMLVMELYLVKNEERLPPELLTRFQKILNSVNRGLITESEYTDLLEEILVDWINEIGNVLTTANR